MQDNTFQPTPAIYTEQLKTKGKTYFFDVKAAKNGNKYVSISETWIRDGQNHRGNITIFQNNLQEFSQALSQALEQAIKA